MDSSFALVSAESLIVFDIGVDAGTTAGIVMPPLTTLGVLNDIVVDGGFAGSAGIASVTNRLTIVPEPGTFWCIAVLLACARLRHVRRGRQ